MPKQLVMDHSGHSTHEFDPANVVSLEEAEARFKELTGRGFTAASKAADGKFDVVRAFDPSAKETLFFPRLVGG
jgi:hypothetical protein